MQKEKEKWKITMARKSFSKDIVISFQVVSFIGHLVSTQCLSNQPDPKIFCSGFQKTHMLEHYDTEMQPRFPNIISNEQNVIIVIFLASGSLASFTQCDNISLGNLDSSVYKQSFLIYILYQLL